MKKLIIPILSLVLSLSTISCNDTSSSKEEGDNHDHSATDHADGDHSSEGVATTAQLMDYYLLVKDALVAGNQEAAASAGSKLAQAAADFDISSLPEAEQQNGREILEVIKENGEHIGKSEMDHQIEHFEAIDTELIDLLNIAGYDKTLYQQYCPMYNDNKGGTWLSDSEEIENPLFKSKMLTCGSVKQTIAQK
jgi:hypothetical protein